MTDAVRRTVLIGVFVGVCWITVGGIAGEMAPPEQPYNPAGTGG